MMNTKSCLTLIIGVFFILAVIRNIKAQDADQYKEGNKTVLDNASYVTQSVPTTMNLGQTYKFIITDKNSGTTTWAPNYAAKYSE
jgi:hypothetical protein